MDKVVTEGTIKHELKRNKKQDKVRGEVNVVVVKGDATFPYVIACSLYDKIQCALFQLWLKMSSVIPSRRKYTVKFRRRLWI